MDVAKKPPRASLFATLVVSFAAGGCTGGGDVTPADAGAEADAVADVGPSIEAIPLEGCGVNYTATVTLGGAQPFTFVLDTGSTITAVAGSSCAACTDAGITPLYSAGSSATDTQQSASEKYANGSGWSGEIYSEAVSVGATSSVSVNLVDISAQAKFFSDLDSYCGASITGILGLGPSALLRPGTSSYLDARAAQGAPDVFAFQLCPSGGKLWLGEFDPAYAPAYTPMVGGLFYSTIVESLGIGGADLGLASSDLGVAFVDTGGDALWLPQKAFDAVVAALGNDASFTSLFGDAASFFALATQRCAPLTQTRAELDAMLPPLALTFGSGIVVQSPATSSYLVHLPNCGYTASLFTRGSGSTGLPPIELGAPILHDKVVVIDRAQKQIGFADAPCH